MEKIIDTHIHVWNFNHAVYEWLEGNATLLNRTYDIEEIAAPREAAGISAGVLVQATNHVEDTDWMLHVAATTPWIQGVVGWLPLTDPEATEKLLSETYLSNPYYKGVRHLIHDESDPRWLLQDTVIESLNVLAKHGLTYDVVGVLPEHIKTVLEVAGRVPDLKMVFDHLNQPPIARGERFGEWGVLMKEAAKNPHFYAKISGLGLTAGKGYDWTAEDLRPYIEFALEHFGTGRCFCGGDWPVALLAGSYLHTWEVYRELLTSLLSREDRQKVFSGNAELFYRL